MHRIKFHSNPSQVQLDNFRDKATKETKWITKRIVDFNTTDFTKWIKRSNSLKIISNNYNKGLDDNWLDILQLTLSPFAIARVQKTIVEFIRSNNLDLKAKEWNILAIERDVPCVALAIEDLKQHFLQTQPVMLEIQQAPHSSRVLQKKHNLEMRKRSAQRRFDQIQTGAKDDQRYHGLVFSLQDT